MYHIRVFELFSPPLSFSHILQTNRNIDGCTYFVSEKSKIAIEYKDIAVYHYNHPQYQEAFKVSATIFTYSKLYF